MKRTFLITVLLVVFVSLQAFSQNIPGYLLPDGKYNFNQKQSKSKVKSRNTVRTQNSSVKFRPYDVLTYDDIKKAERAIRRLRPDLRITTI